MEVLVNMVVVLFVVVDEMMVEVVEYMVVMLFDVMVMELVLSYQGGWMSWYQLSCEMEVDVMLKLMVVFIWAPNCYAY